ncbi:hypothetical protein OU798_02100 [Prolixibacteraceae bacterium Z1-6]|uniref:Uncharacterized protein n=1 Tax=Draconibacterium aestuarii TaxID=2998507 RepID=A0A9X3F3C9_9BACT|nr:hypothetical protein [Prolixibacteraceae bacterium Z1-6]
MKVIFNRKELRSRYIEIRDKLIQYEGVLGVGLGEAEKDGKLTGETAIIVFVEKKLSKNQIKKGQQVEMSYRGVRVDVREPRLTPEAHFEFIKNNDLSERDAEENMDLFWVNDVKLHHMYQKRRKKGDEGKTKETTSKDEPRDAPTTAIHGEIFVIEDADSDSVINADNTIDHLEAYKLFRTQFGDHYDFVFFRPDTPSGVAGGGNSSPTIYNQISGINHYKGDSYNGRTGWGTTKLQSLQKMGFLGQVRTCLHETGHRWGAYVYHQEGGVHNENLHEVVNNASQRPFHWGTWFDNDNSCMDYDYDDWVDSTIVAGEFEIDDLTAGEPGVDEFGFHPLDLYLMGLIDSSEVGTFRYIQNPTDSNGDGSYSGTQVNLNITNITDEEGLRNPSYPNTQRVFHQAFLLITKDMSGIGSLTDPTTPLGELELYRKGLLNAFRRETWSRGMIDGSLLHDNFEDVYIRDNASDSGAPNSTGAFWNSPDIWVRNINDGQTAHQNTIRGRDNFVGVRVWNNGSTDYDDVTIRLYRANYAGTQFYYPENWHPDDLIGEDTVTVPAGSSSTIFIQWEASMIPDASWHPCLLVEIIPMEVVPEERSHVWENRKLAQKNITIIDPPAETLFGELEFKFGHATRIKDKLAILAVARVADMVGMELYLDTDGIEIDLVDNEKILPKKEYMVSGDLVKPSGVIAELGKLYPRLQGGLNLTFPRDTEIILGSGENKNDLGCIAVTIGRGSCFFIHSPSTKGRGTNKLTQIYKDGRMLYRLPDKELVGLNVPIVEKGVLNMKLIVNLSDVHTSVRGGKISLIQMEPDGLVIGGVDLIVRP